MRKVLLLALLVLGSVVICRAQENRIVFPPLTDWELVSEDSIRITTRLPDYMPNPQECGFIIYPYYKTLTEIGVYAVGSGSPRIPARVNSDGTVYAMIASMVKDTTELSVTGYYVADDYFHASDSTVHLTLSPFGKIVNRNMMRTLAGPGFTEEEINKTYINILAQRIKEEGYMHKLIAEMVARPGVGAFYTLEDSEQVSHPHKDSQPLTEKPRAQRPTSVPVINISKYNVNSKGKSVSLQAWVEDDGFPVTERGFLYAKSSYERNLDYNMALKFREGSGSGYFSHVIWNTKKGENYVVRPYAVNAAGVGYGREMRFDTGKLSDFAAAFSTTTDSPSRNSSQQEEYMRLHGEVTLSLGDRVEEHGFCWSVWSTPSFSRSGNADQIRIKWATSQKARSGDKHTFSTRVPLSQFRRNTKLKVRPYVLTQSGTVRYGDTFTVTTP